MKRDPRLQRSGERRSARRLGQGAATRRARARNENTLRIYRLLGLKPRMRRLADGMAELTRTSRAVEEAWAEHVLKPLAIEQARQLTADLGLRGEAYVHVSWDPVLQQATHERIDPSEIQPSLPQPDPPVGGKWCPWQPS